MEYTVERFQQAFKAFIAPPEQETEIAELASFIDDKPYYHLRRHARKKLSALGMPWIDNDMTGTYDPLEDSPRSKRKLTSERRGGQFSRPPKRAKNLSPASLEELQNKIEEQEKQKRSAENRRRKEEEAFLSSGPFDYNLRTRTKPSEILEKGLGNAKMANDTDPGEQDTLGSSLSHKGCLACRDLQIECSLIEYPFSYPCSDCRDDRIECKLDPSPIWKRPCEGCKRRRAQCSYSSGDYDHKLPCHFCLQHGFDCVAGPARKQPTAGQSQTTNMEMTDDPQGYKTHHTMAEDATAEANGGSSHLDLDESNQFPLETEAESEVSLRSKISVIAGTTPTPSTTLSETSERPALNASDQTCHRLTGVQTSLKLWHEISTDGSKPCNWCYNFAYGISGDSELSHEIMSKSYDHILGQQRADTQGREPRRMCINCTIARISILKCPHDKIQSLSGSPISHQEVRAAFDELAKASVALESTSDQAGKCFPLPGYPWCAICREPAFYLCTSHQEFANDEWSLGQYIPSDPGCGLRLCDYCAHYAQVYRGDLDAVVKKGQEDTNNKTELRADVEFILKRSPDNPFKRLAGLE
ncbi:uncharacterized protein N7498_008879 [Penicillium cinerascens]|uniref:Zn(2)-C6 fungal-type domain-containing protein n=1 Tax=Penicillium cinerascens TaxID=70096 RepID=A0A9W9JG72_9EURO|nr:uncharacterized protein N7498_008879 [Penicillium cinerascens]KAJ5195441.1 hypothetical protein N7498_008879 [Penicillium cinerascens]